MHPALFPITVPLSLAYRAAVEHRNARFDAGKGVQSCERPVISVGNITVGGTGKSPIVRWICEQLVQSGHHPMIAMRGYRPDDSGVSDEQAEYAAHFADRVPVAAHPNRLITIRRTLLDQPEIDCVVLDDGFQHRQLARDLDLVLIDASQHTFSQRLLPAGMLREPIENLQRADGVIITRAGDRTAQLAQQIERVHGQAPLAITRHVWRSLVVVEADKPPRDEPLKWLDGRGLTTCLGVGNPKSIEQQIMVAGGIIRTRVPAADHQQYDPAFVRRLRKACSQRGMDALIITTKDWVKLRSRIDSAADWPVAIVIPQLQIKFISGADAMWEAVRTTVE